MVAASIPWLVGLPIRGLGIGTARRLQQRAKTSASKAKAAASHADWEAVVGLELHAQIVSNSKIFSGAAVQFAAPPNTLVALLDAGLPGTLPVLNARCVEAAVLTGLALNGTVAPLSTFDRKHYFYFDLPLGYQITQQRRPIVSGGHLTIASGRDMKVVRIERLHLEQDTGKSMHDHASHTLVDLNRAGTGLMEIVTHPDLSSGDEAAVFVRKLQALVQDLGTCTGKMAEGSLRVDANVSVRRRGETEKGTRVEIKNVNGTRHLKKAIDYEIQRQIGVLTAGGQVTMETRMFAWQEGVTKPLRTKERDKDYRYMPEADLPPLCLTEEYIDGLRQQLPELPDAKRTRLVDQFKLSAYDAAVLVDIPGLAELFEKLARPETGDMTAKWLVTDLMGALNARDMDLSRTSIDREQLADILQMLADGTLSAKGGKDTLSAILDGDTDPARAIVKKHGWEQLDDENVIRSACEAVVAEQAKMVERYRAGQEGVLKALMGQVMKRCQGRANPKTANRLLMEALRK